MKDTQTHKFHEIVIDFSSTALHNENVFPADRLSHLNSSLADGKLGELGQSQLRALSAARGVLPAALLGGCRGGRISSLLTRLGRLKMDRGSKSFTGELRVACTRGKVSKFSSVRKANPGCDLSRTGLELYGPGNGG